MPRPLSRLALALAGFLAPWCCLADQARADISFSVEITDTETLPSAFTAPFALDFQFADASFAGDANNTVTISNFIFGGDASLDFAHPVINPQLIPGTTLITVSSGEVLIQDGLQGTNEVWLPFTPGSLASSSISFDVSITPAVLDTGNAFDSFSLQILQQVDVSPNGVPTVDGSGFIVTAGVDLTQGPLTVNSIAPPGAPVPGVDATLLGGPSVPEPATLSLFAMGLVGLVASGWPKIRRL